MNEQNGIVRQYWLYRLIPYDDLTSLLLKYGYILINLYSLLPSERNTLTNSHSFYADLKIAANDIIVLPIGGNTLSFFVVNTVPKQLKEELYRIKQICLETDNEKYIEHFNDFGLENCHVIKISVLKDHIPISECTDMEFVKYMKDFRTSRNITRFAKEIEAVLKDADRTSDATYLLKELSESNDVKEYFNLHRDSIRYSDPVGYLQYLLKIKHLSVASVGKHSGQGDYVYKIFKGEREPSRDVILSISIGMRLSLDETQRLLNFYKLAELNVKDSRDAIIIFGIIKNKNIQEVNDMLYDNHKSTLFN